MRVLPILFNTDMVRAILDGRKTVTRRVVKGCNVRDDQEINKNLAGKFELYNITERCGIPQRVILNPLCRAGDILYVRETWNTNPLYDYGDEPNEYVYKVDYDGHAGDFGWKPSIHMPKEAARIWLKVTDVRVERLKDITDEQAMKEGFSGIRCRCGGTAYACADCYNSGWIEPPFVGFMYTWDSTIKKADIDRYGWDTNPWVWVVEFERCEKPERNLYL